MNSNKAVDNKTTRLHMGLIAAVTLIAYCKVFAAGFLSWDDAAYVLQNPDIRAFNLDNFRLWFSGYYVGNYHPLTMLSYTIDYAIGGSAPFVYHLSGVLLHVLNGGLVYLLIKKLQPESMVALFTALLFALHPVQTESVSWVAERKTVLSSFFLLLALRQYVSYASAPSLRGMAWVIGAGAAAMLSKGTAVALPLSIIAIDVWLGRPLLNRKIWTEKLPLFLAAIAVGIVAIKAQQSGSFLERQEAYSFAESVLYAGCAYASYIGRLFIPVGLSAMYPYPVAIGVVQYLYLAMALAVVSLGIIAYRKKWMILAGGILFFTVNILFVLQFIRFGEALTADRYLYLASIGIVYPVVYYLFIWLRRVSVKRIFSGLIATVSVVLLVLTFIRNDAWLSDKNFFNALLETYPNSAVAQYSVGGMFLKAGDYAQAAIHLDKAVRLDPNSYKAWHSKGLLHMRQGRAMEALDALDKSIAINGYVKAYFTRAMLHQSTGHTAQALADIEQVLAAQPANGRAWHIKGSCMEQQGDIQAAMTCYDRAIAADKKEPLFYIRRGLLYSKKEMHTQAMQDMEAAVALNPASGEAHYYLGMVKYQAGSAPCMDLQTALSYGYTPAKAAIEKLCRQ
ncbi:MAG: tetratricopeptide repeat protein [Taibaiella sp.]|nr:tetratricopeptide repeat protein [Taibaiella sp.]